ncbi:hypothetical protein [Bacillus manliponensis]|uniref:hypothetical protein n=1 Tax=Bacillus manliponensis TaxID=574376 RepID=UPI00054EFDB9|nr:hypothetical protein [Bacillus manliponensis]
MNISFGKIINLAAIILSCIALALTIGSIFGQLSYFGYWAPAIWGGSLLVAISVTMFGLKKEGSKLAIRFLKISLGAIALLYIGTYVLFILQPFYLR